MTDLTAVSLFAGIGGFDLALQRAGVKVVAAVEIDPAARSVLAKHFPDTKLFTDVREVTGDQLLAAGFVPERGILTGGFPCQDLSVAGRRRGMGEGTRSGLYWEIDRLMAELQPAWVFLENVPGLLSAVCPDPDTEVLDLDGLPTVTDEDGFLPDDFEPRTGNGAKGACEGGCFAAHGGAMGLVLGSLADRGYGFAYRVLDAQYTGVPQRRRRVFIVGRAGGDSRGPVEILLEPEGRRRHSAPGGQAQQDVAGTLGSRAGGSRTTDLDGHGAYIVNALTANGVGGGGGPDDNAAAAGHLIASALTARQAKGPDSNATTTLVAATLTSGTSAPGVSQPGRRTEDDSNLVVETLRSHPRPGSNSVGAVVPVAVRGRGEGAQIEAAEPGDPAFTLRTPRGGSSYPMVATTGEVTHALTAEGADASEDGTGRGTPIVPMAFNPQSGGSKARLGYGETPTALTTNQITAVQVATAVRRLTPLECERLQGFPDEWTAGQSDAARYRELGNAVAVPCVQWATDRIVAVDARQESAA